MTPCYYFPIIIRPQIENNWRAHYLKLQKKADVNFVPRNYIIELPQGDIEHQDSGKGSGITGYALFKLRTRDKDVNLISNENPRKNIPVVQLNFTPLIEEFPDHCKLVINIKKDAKTKRQSPQPLNKSFMHIEEKDDHIYLTLGNKNIDQIIDKRIDVEFRYKEDAEDKEETGNDEETDVYSDRFTLYITREARVFYAALDFGSDASQISWVRAKDELKQHKSVKIIDQLAKNIGIKLPEVGAWQKEPGHSELIKSIYFIKSNLEERYDETAYEAYSLKDSNKDIKMVVDDNTTVGAYHLLPNLKLYSLDFMRANTVRLNVNYEFTIDDSIFDLGDIYEEVTRQLINNYINVLLHDLSQQLPKEDGPISLNFRLLVPNVFGEEQVRKLIRNVYADFEKVISDVNAIIQQKNEQPKENANGRRLFLPQIAAIEVAVISESDTAIVHRVKTQGDFYKNKNILTIDCGKGTTDIGICNVDEQAHITSVYRCGFAGAGNYLTYGYFEYFMGLLKAIDENDIRSINLKTDSIFRSVIRKSRNLGIDSSALEQITTAIEDTDHTRGKMVENKSKLHKNIQAIKAFLIGDHENNLDEFKYELEELMELELHVTKAGIKVTKLNDFKKKLFGCNVGSKLELTKFFNTIKEASIDGDGEYYTDWYVTLEGTIGGSTDAFIAELMFMIKKMETDGKRCIRSFYSTDEPGRSELPIEVESRVKNIGNAIIQKIDESGYFYNNSIDVIFLTGRCLKHKPLYEYIKYKLKEMKSFYESMEEKSKRKKGGFKSFVDKFFKPDFEYIETTAPDPNKYNDLFIFEETYDFLKHNCVLGGIIKDAGINHGADWVGVLMNKGAMVNKRFNDDLFFKSIPWGRETDRKDGAVFTLNEDIYGELKDSEESQIYYVGEGFLLQTIGKGGVCKLLKREQWKSKSKKAKDDVTELDYSKMLEESFFPFNTEKNK